MIGLKHGELKEIAEELGISHQSVRAYMQGRFKSKRIQQVVDRRQQKNIAEFQKAQKA